MMFNMPTLPYAHNALEPVISQATIDFHYGKHLQTYVNNRVRLSKAKRSKKSWLLPPTAPCSTMPDRY